MNAHPRLDPSSEALVNARDSDHRPNNYETNSRVNLGVEHARPYEELTLWETADRLLVAAQKDEHGQQDHHASCRADQNDRPIGHDKPTVEEPSFGNAAQIDAGGARKALQRRPRPAFPVPAG
jgi:hypothetical protein